MNKKVFDYLIIILPIAIVAGLGSLFTNMGQEWFDNLIKPSQWIPDIIFPIIWTVIYLTTAVFLIFWIKTDKIPTSTIVFLIINGILNILWCLIFFTLKLTFIGNVIIILNLIASILLLCNIYKFKDRLALILILYPVWMCLASTLNLATWILN